MKQYHQSKKNIFSFSACILSLTYSDFWENEAQIVFYWFDLLKTAQTLSKKRFFLNRGIILVVKL